MFTILCLSFSEAKKINQTYKVYTRARFQPHNMQSNKPSFFHQYGEIVVGFMLLKNLKVIV